MEKVLVAGAHGTTGKKIIDLLKSSHDFHPVAMVRKDKQREYFEKMDVETVWGDLEEDISHTVKGIDRVIFAAGSSGKKVKKVDRDGAKKLIDESKNAKVKKFVMLSSMGADNPQSVEDLKEYLEAKQNADEYLRNKNLPYTIVRPGSLTNNDASHKIEIAEKLNKRGEISRSDVAETLVNSLGDDRANSTTFEILEGETLIPKAVKNV